MSEAFKAWQDFSQTTPELHIGNIVSGGCGERLSAEVIAAYDAPFPDESYKEGARQFPTLVPTSPEDPATTPTSPRGPYWQTSRSRFSVASVATRSPEELTRSSSARFPDREVRRTRPLRAAPISCKKRTARSWLEY